MGGKELDEAVGAIILNQFEQALGSSPNLTARGLLELRRVSEAMKIGLCSPGTRVIRETVLLAGRAVEVTVRQSQFEDHIRGLVDRTEKETLLCLKEAGLARTDLSAVLLVGGSSLVPMVSERLRILFGPDLVRYHEPSKAVALGAALHGSQLAGDAARCNVPPEFRGVSGYCVGVRAIRPETGRVMTDTLIRKNMPLPARAKKVYYTTRMNQQRMVLEIVQYRSSEESPVSLGQLVVGPLPSPRRNYPIEVTLENCEDGTKAVQAYDSQTGVELAQVFGREGVAENAAVQRALIRSTFINNL